MGQKTVNQGKETKERLMKKNVKNPSTILTSSVFPLQEVTDR